MARILLLEDDPVLGESLQDLLEAFEQKNARHRPS